MALTLVFVHGWSVTNLNTYGELPLRLKAEASANGIELSVKEIFLGSYISFHDEVKVKDISFAFKNVVDKEIAPVLENGSRFICITHSTGGPVVRDWWNTYYKDQLTICPMSHLIMLAPANYGSALAQLGKGKLSRLKSWWNGVEPGNGVLNWLALGSSESWELNKSWIKTGSAAINENGIFPFVLTGQDIDRKFYDHLNPYTGELGSDGVVRVSSANLRGRLISLVQPKLIIDASGKISVGEFIVKEVLQAPDSPLKVLKKRAHSGDAMGIMKSVKGKLGRDENSETIAAILNCIKVKSVIDYKNIYRQFALETEVLQKEELVEAFDEGIFSDERYFIHDRFSMVMFKIHDHEGNSISDYDIILTAGETNSPNLLPEGFFADRQRNAINVETLTYFLNYDVMKGCAEIRNIKGEIIRDAIKGTTMIGLEIRPRPENGFVHYLPCHIKASVEMLDNVLVPNSTTLIDICMYRIVDQQVFQAQRLNKDLMPGSVAGDFSGLKPNPNNIS